MGKAPSFKGDCQSPAAVLLHGMESWLSNFWSHLHTAEGLRQTIELGGISLMCLIIFAETGLLAGFFLPGDSLLVTAGGLSIANGDRPAYFSPWELTGALTIASVVGDQTGYWLGRRYGKTMESKPDTWWYKRRHLLAARDYFSEKGPLAIVLARFVPLMRTFVPFVAGVAEMSRPKFSFYNIAGALLWVVGLVTAGYLFGNMPWVQANLSKIIWAMVIIPGLVAAYGAWHAGRVSRAGSAQAGRQT